MYDEYPYRVRTGSRRSRRGGTIVLAIIFSLIGGIVGSAVTNVFNNSRGETQTGAPVVATEIKTTDEMGAVAAVATAAMPSTVGITQEKTQMSIFGPLTSTSSGSGFIADEGGYIVSNAHVVGSAGEKVTVLLNDGSKEEGEVLWSDGGLDLGIVKIDRTDLTPMNLGDSENIQIGALAVAIGNPLGLDLQRSVTAGVISGLNRSLGGEQGGYMEGLIQTDASINQGNSGGPLLNAQGEVIGINSAKIAGGEGLGFAIPVNVVKPILKQVLEHGNTQTLALGIGGYSVSMLEKQTGNSLGTDGKGVVIINVEPGSPAAEAGLRSRDVLLSMDGNPVNNMSSLRQSLYNYQVGDQVELEILREGQKEKLSLTFQEYSIPVQGSPQPQEIQPYRGN
ncbi:MAG: trypsin-like peptidase domain-containing protein [Tissierellia bacterium]|nr:trypsin-like peptidase domain-containing protein [Tissierellia bacterium]